MWVVGCIGCAAARMAQIGRLLRIRQAYVLAVMCVSWPIAHFDPIKYRRVCALVMYVFRRGGPSCLYMRLGVLCSSWVWGSVWIKSEVVYIAETVRSQRAVFAFVCARAC